MNDDQIYEAIAALRQHYDLATVLHTLQAYCNTHTPRSTTPNEWEQQGESFALGAIVSAASTNPERHKDQVDAMAEVMRYVTGHTWVSNLSAYPSQDQDIARGENRIRRRILNYLNQHWFSHLHQAD